MLAFVDIDGSFVLTLTVGIITLYPSICNGWVFWFIVVTWFVVIIWVTGGFKPDAIPFLKFIISGLLAAYKFELSIVLAIS